MAEYGFLHRAAYDGNTEAVKEIIRLGADVNAPYRGCTALIYALVRGHLEVVGLLLESGAKKIKD